MPVANLFSGAAAVVDPDVWDTFLKPGSKYLPSPEGVPESARDLLRCGFLTSEGVDELGIVKVHFQSVRHDTHRQVAVIAPSLRCNLRCSYCYQAEITDQANLRCMDEETQQQVVRYVTGLCDGKERLLVTWHGGEPLLMLDTLDRMSCEFLNATDRRGVSYDATAATNAVLLNASVASRLAEMRVASLQITLDTPPSAKRYRNGKPVPRERILDGISSALASGLAVHLRINVSAADERDLDEMYGLLIDRGLHHQIKDVCWATVFPSEHESPTCSSCTLTGPDMYRLVRREVRKARAIGLPTQGWKVSAAGPCKATTAAYVVIGPEGELCHCPKDLGNPSRAHGSVFADQPARVENLLPWLTYDWFQYDMCRECPVQPSCAAGCPHARRYQPDMGTSNRLCSYLRFALGDGALQEDLRAWAMEQGT